MRKLVNGMLKTIILFQLFLVFTSYSFASEPFNFMSDVIRSLQSCKIAEEKTKAIDSNGFALIMKDILVFNNEINSANSMIAPYRNSKNELIRQSTENLSAIYSSIVVHNEQYLSFLEKSLNKPKEAVSELGTWLRKGSEIIAAREESWGKLPYTIIMTTYTLVDQKQIENGKIRFLTITQVERDQLRSQLLNAFGEQVKDATKGSRLPVDVSAALLWKFLSDNWKPADTK